MPRPLHVQLIAPIEPELHSLAFEFIDNRPVINPPDRHPLPVALIVKPRSLFLDVDNIDGPYPEHLLRQQKIRQRLLMQRIDLHQNHILRIMPTNNGSPQKFLIRGLIEPAKKIFELARSRGQRRIGRSSKAGAHTHPDKPPPAAPDTHREKGRPATPPVSAATRRSHRALAQNPLAQTSDDPAHSAP